MNKVILLGRLTRDPEVRFAQKAEPLATIRFGIAVSRRFKRENEPDADFLNCVAFGKTAEFIDRYFRKGNMISVVGRISTNSWTDNTGQKRYSTDIIIDEAYFCESKAAAEAARIPYYPPARDNKANLQSSQSSQSDESADDDSSTFYNVDQGVDDDLPF